MSDANFNKCPYSLSLNVLDKYYLIALEKGPMTQHAVLNMLAFYPVYEDLN